MEKKFKYRFDKRVKILTAVEIALIVLAVCLTMYFADSYMKAWVITILTAVVALFALSIPRYIKVTDEALEIHCIVELTRIMLEDVVSIRKISYPETGHMFLLLGSYGFFGYYGYYFNTKDWENIKVYASEWGNFVEIEDIYEQKYIVSCREADELIEAVVRGREARET